MFNVRHSEKDKLKGGLSVKRQAGYRKLGSGEGVRHQLIARVSLTSVSAHSLGHRTLLRDAFHGGDLLHLSVHPADSAS